MSLVLFRRHIKACTVHKTKLSARAKRLFLGCDCPIWIYGRTDDGIVPRQSTGFTTMPEAEALRASLVAESQSEEVRGPRIRDCITKYLESRRHELSDKTYYQPRAFTLSFEDLLPAAGCLFHA